MFHFGCFLKIVYLWELISPTKASVDTQFEHSYSGTAA